MKQVLQIQSKAIILVFTLCLLWNNGNFWAQSQNNIGNAVKTDSIASQHPNDKVILVETMPEFPGGVQNLLGYLKRNIKYPKDAIKNHIQGTVFIRFVVDSIGKVDKVEVLRSVEYDLDKEAVRVVKMMPQWQPGTQGGKNVTVNYTLPIRFKL